MSAAVAQSAAAPGGAGPRLVGALRRRYLWALGVVAILVLLDQALVQPLLVRVSAYAPAINLAGRQRMLSQKLVKEALAWQTRPNAPKRAHHRAELAATREAWATAHAALAQGDKSLTGRSGDDSQLAAAWRSLQPQFAAMNAAVDQLLMNASSAPTAVQTDALLEIEPRYLAAMEQVVALLQAESRREIALLRGLAFAIGAAILAALIGLGWAVVLPATRLIRAQVDDLEHRVAERTSDLAQANEELSLALEERRAAQADLHELGLQLAHAGRVSSLGHLSAGLAHELNQPLAAITNFAEAADVLLDRTEVDPGLLRGQVREIRAVALRAGQIVRRMRDFVRPTSSVRQDLELGQLVRDVLELCRPEAERDGAACVVRLGTQELPVSGDPIQIQQVLVNLVQNALHALRARPAGERRLEISARLEEGQVCVTVCDSGPGFTTAEFARLGEPFFTTKPDGLGLGLAICRVLIERHGGRLWAEPVAAGACLRFVLPARVEYAAAECDDADDCIRR